MPHGQGAYTWADGDKYVGEYKDGSAWTGITYDKNGSVVSKLTEGVRTTILGDSIATLAKNHGFTITSGIRLMPRRLTLAMLP